MKMMGIIKEIIQKMMHIAPEIVAMCRRSNQGQVNAVLEPYVISQYQLYFQILDSISAIERDLSRIEMELDRCVSIISFRGAAHSIKYYLLLFEKNEVAFTKMGRCCLLKLNDWGKEVINRYNDALEGSVSGIQYVQSNSELLFGRKTKSLFKKVKRKVFKNQRNIATKSWD